MEGKKVETGKDVRSDYENMIDPYQKALKKDWQGFKEFYDANSGRLFSSLTVNGDNAFHFAAARKDALLVKTLLEKLPHQSEKYRVVTERDNHKITALHEVATTNCVKAAELMLDILLNPSSKSGDEEENKHSLQNLLSEDRKNLLIAAALGKTKMVQYLAKKIDPNVLHKHFTRYDDISILHIAIIGQHFETAKWLLTMEEKVVPPRRIHKEEEGKLTKRVEKNGMTGFNLLALMPSAFASGRPRSIMEEFVYSCLPTFLVDAYKDEDEEEDDKLPSSREQDLETGKNYKNNHQAEKQTVISKMWNAMWSGPIQGYPELKNILKEKRKHESARELVELLVEQDTSWTESYKSDVDETISLGLGKGEGRKLDDSQYQKFPSGSSKTFEVIKKKRSSIEAPLLTAASNGITEIVKPIVHKYPQAVDYTSDYGQNMLHAAIMFRQKEIFDYILGMEKKVVHNLAARIDNNGNTLLHHVADMHFYRGGTRRGPAFQFQEELEWFENVKAITPSYYTMHRNKKKTTAGDLFEEQHAKQFESAQQWMKDTAQSCSTVSILVATVVIAAAYAVPGGNNDHGRRLLDWLCVLCCYVSFYPHITI